MARHDLLASGLTSPFESEGSFDAIHTHMMERQAWRGLEVTIRKGEGSTESRFGSVSAGLVAEFNPGSGHLDGLDWYHNSD